MNHNTTRGGALATAAAGANGIDDEDEFDEDDDEVDEVATATPGSPDEVDASLASCLLDDMFATVQAGSAVFTISIEKPNKKLWTACHPTMEARRVAAIEMPEDRGSGIYVVRKDIVPFVPSDEITIVALHLATTKSGKYLLWPAKHGDDSWAISMREAIEAAKGDWIRLVSKRSEGRYEAKPPKNDLGKPTWPNKTFAEIFAIATKDRVIDSVNHPVLKVLRGEF